MKKKVLPWPGSDSSQMRPPWHSTTFLQIASPMPLPGYCLLLCNRWKTKKMRAAYCRSMPMPLS